MELVLSERAVRVLGVLLEKELATPANYPISASGLIQGCNQKTNRSPVVTYTEGNLEQALDELAKLRLIGTSTGGGSRVTKFRHLMVDLDEHERSLVAVLLLRGPQTVGELRSRTARLADFKMLDDVLSVVGTLVERGLVCALPRQPGKKESRYFHTFGPLPSLAADPFYEDAAPNNVELVQSLKHEMLSLRQELDALKADFLMFRSQFE